MKKLFKAFLIIMSVILISIYLFYAIDFGLELMGFVEIAEREGFREALSQEGSSDIEFYASAATLALMTISILIIPSILVLAAIVYFLRRQRKIV